VEDAICDAFGFSDTYINIVNSYENNSSTMPTSFAIDLGSNKLIKSAKRASSKTKGYRFDPKDQIVFTITMYSGMLLNPVYTDAEITAVTLHEIGHNFTATSERSTRILAYVPALSTLLRATADIVAQVLTYAAQGIIAIGAVPAAVQIFITCIISESNSLKNLNGRIGRLIDNWLKDLEKNNPGAFAIFGGLSVWRSMYLDILAGMQYVNKLFPNPLLLPLQAISGFANSIGRPAGYADEKFADAFPRMYGYGAENISALNKMDIQPSSSMEKVADQIAGPVQAISSIYTTPFYMVVYMFDEHPYTSDRAKFMLEDLKSELNDKSCTLSPTTKKQMIKDAGKIQKELDTYLDSAATIKASKAVGLRAWENAMQTIFGGSIKSKIKSRHVNDDINAFFDDLD
jgi:Zn-dependent protease with chaperone function